jgi:ubiquinone/menaquinone biosynthesis C-methylase UbiE
MQNKPKVFYNDPSFDYKKYWSTREYENQSEKIALKKLLALISKKGTLIDIGGGFGRLTSEYAPLFKSCLLVEPSEKLLDEAKKLCSKYKNLSVGKSFVEKLPVGSESFDVALLIRVLHHLTNLSQVIKEVKRVLKPNGYLILEFANRIHFKNCLKAFIRLDFKFFTDHTPKDISQKLRVAPFFNYHPNQIKTLFLGNGFKIIKSLPVSNFRHPLCKRLIPLKVLLSLESFLQLLTSYFPFLKYSGPSIFILAQRVQK